MRVTPLDVHEQSFRVGFRGFDPQEVDLFLQRVADELERLIDERDGLQAELLEERKARQSLEEALVACQEAQTQGLEAARGEAEIIQHQAQLRADRVLAQANEELLRLRRELQEAGERRSQCLAELGALAQALQDWIAERTAQEVFQPDLLGDENDPPALAVEEPARAADPAEDD